MLRVVKVGGSTLTRSDLADVLPQWIEEQPPAVNLIIVGGGELIDAVRKLDQVRPMPPGAVHWRCVDLLQATFETLAEWFPDWLAIDVAPDQLASAVDCLPGGSTSVVSVRSFYGRDSAGDFARLLPATWDTTTDAIAALLAAQLRAAELVILKSCDVDSSRSMTELSEEGIVDNALPMITPHLNRIRIERLP